MAVDFLTKALATARAKGENLGLQRQNALSDIDIQWKPQKYRSDINLQDWQAREIPSKIEGNYAQAALQRGQLQKIPSEIAQNYAQAAYQKAEANAKILGLPSEIAKRLAESAKMREEARLMEYNSQTDRRKADASFINADVNDRRYSPEQLQSMLTNRNALTATMPNRNLSQTGKMIVEKNYLNQGLAPTGQTWDALNNSPWEALPQNAQPGIPQQGMPTPLMRGGIPLQAQQMPNNQLPQMAPNPSMPPNAPIPGIDPRSLEGISAYDLKQLKNVTDPRTRARLIDGINMEKTIKLIDPKIMSQFAGAAGRWKRFGNYLATPFGKESKEYDKYRVMKDQYIKDLGKQMRRFFQDSIQPEVQEQYEFIANPDSWSNNPKLAETQYRGLVAYLKNEIKTVRDAAKNPQVYFDEDPEVTQPVYDEDYDKDMNSMEGVSGEVLPENTQQSELDMLLAARNAKGR